MSESTILEETIKAAREIAQKNFDSATSEPKWLELEDLERLQGDYSYPPKHDYSKDILVERGEERANLLLDLLPGTTLNSFLELGCGDGMVSYSLMKKGKEATAIDRRDTRFDPRAEEAGIVKSMEVDNLEFDDDSLDVVFSFSAFEHFPDPNKALAEMYRVTKPGGYIYIDFGPLYMSPLGLHAYRSITVPYCQHLFEQKTIVDFLKKNDKPILDFSYCNGWSYVKYKKLWDSFAGRLEKEYYKEILNHKYLELVNEYPSCFKSKTDEFDDLTCSYIKVLFKKV